MARTTVDNVEGIIDIDSGISLTPFIEVANRMVTDVVVAGYDSYTAVQLELIERWLTAHFYHIRDPRATDEKAGAVSVRYQSKVDLGLDVTHYGQMAMRLDFYGSLAALNERIKKGGVRSVGITYLGTVPETYTEDET
jgi:hypothetical protein